MSLAGWLLLVLTVLVAVGVLRRPEILANPLAAVCSWLESRGTEFSTVNLAVDWRKVISGLVTLSILGLLSTADVAILATTVQKSLLPEAVGQGSSARSWDALEQRNAGASSLPKIETDFGSAPSATASPSLLDRIEDFTNAPPKLFVAFAFFGIALICGYFLSEAFGIGSESGQDGAKSNTPPGVRLRYLAIGSLVYVVLLFAQIQAAQAYRRIVLVSRINAEFPAALLSKQSDFLEFAQIKHRELLDKTLKAISDPDSPTTNSVEHKSEFVRYRADRELEGNSDNTVPWVVAAMSLGALTCGLLKSQVQESVVLVVKWVGNLFRVTLGFGMQLLSKLLAVGVTLIAIPKEIAEIASSKLEGNRVAREHRRLIDDVKRMYRPQNDQAYSEMAPHELADILLAQETIRNKKASDVDKKAARLRIDCLLGRNMSESAFQNGAIRRLNFLTNAELANLRLDEYVRFTSGDERLLMYPPAMITAPDASAEVTINRLEACQRIDILRPDPLSVLNLVAKADERHFAEVLVRHAEIVAIFRDFDLDRRQIESLVFYGRRGQATPDEGDFERFFGVDGGVWRTWMVAFRELAEATRTLLDVAFRGNISLEFPRHLFDVAPAPPNGSDRSIRMAASAWNTLSTELAARPNLNQKLRNGALRLEHDWFFGGDRSNFDSWIKRESARWDRQP